MAIASACGARGNDPELSRPPARESPVGEHEYRLFWECPSAACVMAHGDVIWENLTPDEWDALPWEQSYRVADGGDIFTQRQTLEGWAEDHYEPVRNVRFERRVRPNPDEGWEVAIRGATGVTHWKATSEGER